MADYTQIKLDIADGIATLTLHRPEKMNAFTRVMMDEIISAIDTTDADDSVRAVIFTGHGDRAFCAGADLTPQGGGHVFSDPNPVEDLSDERMDAVFRTHLYGAIHVLRPAWRAMKAAGYGRIVTTSSATALGVDGSFDYPAAKAGLIGLTRSLAREGREHGIHVNTIMPLAYTRMAAGVPNKEIRDWMSATFPPERVAPLVAWLCHEAAAVSGDIFTVGGGRAARVTTNVYPGYRSQDDRPESFRDHWNEVMSGGDPEIALDGSVDAAMMDPGYASLGSTSMKGGT